MPVGLDVRHGATAPAGSALVTVKAPAPLPSHLQRLENVGKAKPPHDSVVDEQAEIVIVEAGAREHAASAVRQLPREDDFVHGAGGET